MTKKADVDMSPEAVASRIEEIRALYKLMAYLRQARVVEARPVDSKRRTG
jgi:hypothetical protein